MPRSLQGRFLAISFVTGVGALLLAAYAVGEVIRDVVMDGAEEVYAGQQARIRDAVDGKGRFHADRVVFLKEFSQSPALWGWAVATPAGQWRQGPAVRIVEEARSSKEDGGRLQLARGQTPAGNAVHVREWKGRSASGMPLAITIIGSDQMFQEPFLRSRLRLWFALGVVSLAIVALVAAQLRWGFSPLRDVQRDLAAVRAGRIRLLDENLPDELRPLAREVNALIEQNEAGLQHARLNLANLAHSLKTPLATLSLRLPREGASEKSLALLQQLDARIRHHLGRARSAALSAGERAQCQPFQIVARLIDVMHGLYGTRNLRIGNAIDADVMLAIDPQDLDEMVGNLLENACRFARSCIDVDAVVAGRVVHLTVQDDGPGLEPDQMRLAMEPGTRLEEDGAGFGFGLGLVGELAHLYGGSLELSRAPLLGGLRAELVLPLYLD